MEMYLSNPIPQRSIYRERNKQCVESILKEKYGEKKIYIKIGLLKKRLEKDRI